MDKPTNNIENEAQHTIHDPTYKERINKLKKKDQFVRKIPIKSFTSSHFNLKKKLIVFEDYSLNKYIWPQRKYTM